MQKLRELKNFLAALRDISFSPFSVNNSISLKKEEHFMRLPYTYIFNTSAQNIIKIDSLINRICQCGLPLLFAMLLIVLGFKNFVQYIYMLFNKNRTVENVFFCGRRSTLLLTQKI